MTGLSLFIEKLLQTFLAQLDFKRRRPLGLLDEGLKDQNAPRGSGVIKRSEIAVFLFHAEFSRRKRAFALGEDSFVCSWGSSLECPTRGRCPEWPLVFRKRR